MPLFYIAFYQLDVITLRAEIVSLFMSMLALYYIGQCSHSTNHWNFVVYRWWDSACGCGDTHSHVQAVFGRSSREEIGQGWQCPRRHSLWIWRVWRLPRDGCPVWGECNTLVDSHSSLRITKVLEVCCSYYCMLKCSPHSITPQYITLFASAFPLGAAVTFIFLYMEIRSDLFKLIRAYRRPFARRS